LEGETVVGKLDRMGFAVASGSACSSANPEPSTTLLAMGVERDTARGAIRVSLGPKNTLNDVEGLLLALQQLVNELKRLTAMSC
jgi:cysteine desulfurase